MAIRIYRIPKPTTHDPFEGIGQSAHPAYESWSKMEDVYDRMWYLRFRVYPGRDYTPGRWVSCIVEALAAPVDHVDRMDIPLLFISNVESGNFSEIGTLVSRVIGQVVAMIDFNLEAIKNLDPGKDFVVDFEARRVDIEASRQGDVV